MPRMKKNALSIAIVDDHPLVLFALRSLIEDEPGWSVWQECQSPSELLEHLSDGQPDMVVIDLCYADESGIDVLQKLKDQYPDVRVLVYSGNEEKEYADRCFKLGASGYVSKEEPVTNVREAINCVVQGYAYVSDRLVESVIGEVPPSDQHVA
jgi:two-component system, NarL family, response regulator EvgA